MWLVKFAKHSIELIVVAGILYIAYLTFYPGAAAVSKVVAHNNHLQRRHGYIGLGSVWGPSGGSAIIRPSRLR
jgi:hypothetical protein